MTYEKIEDAPTPTGAEHATLLIQLFASIALLLIR